MKKWIGLVLMVAGLVVAACGAYGLYEAAGNAQVAQWGGFDEAIAMMRSAASLKFSQRLMVFTLENRVPLLIGGLIAAVIGFFVKRSEK